MGEVSSAHRGEAVSRVAPTSPVSQYASCREIIICAQLFNKYLFVLCSVTCTAVQIKNSYLSKI